MKIGSDAVSLLNPDENHEVLGRRRAGTWKHNGLPVSLYVRKDCYQISYLIGDFNYSYAGIDLIRDSNLE